MVEQVEKIKFFDPHFHLVDWAEGPHKDNEALWKTLYPQMPVFGIKDYENLILGDNDPVELMGGMFIEANAPEKDRIAEANWVDKQLDNSTRPYGIIAGINLQDDITETLKANRCLARFRGFRNILNWDEGAEVNMDPEVTSNRFLEDKVKANFKILETEDVTFELMSNPHQYSAAAEIFEACPKLRVIIDHRGFPKTVEQIKSDEYWTGMKRFAALPNIFMKISFFARTDAEWKDGATVIEKSIELIKLFGADRCMFATNFPVDNADIFGTWTMSKMLETFKAIAKDFTPEQQACLWRETALKAYRMDLAAGDGFSKK